MFVPMVELLSWVVFVLCVSCLSHCFVFSLHPCGHLLENLLVILSSRFCLSSDFAISKAWATVVTRFTTVFLSHFF